MGTIRRSVAGSAARMRRRENLAAAALGAGLTSTALLVAALLPGAGSVPGHDLGGGGGGALRLAAPPARGPAVAEVARDGGAAGAGTGGATAPVAGGGAAAGGASGGAPRSRSPRRQSGGAVAPDRHERATPDVGARTRGRLTSPAATPTPAPPAATPAPGATPAPSRPSTPTAHLALSVASAEVSGGQVDALLSVGDAGQAHLPSQLALRMNVAAPEQPAEAPVTLDAALDLVTASDAPSGVKLRMRMQLADDGAAPPVVPDDGSRLSNVVTLHVPIPAGPGDTPAPPTSPTSGTPAEVQLPIAPADTPPDETPPSETNVELDPPAAGDAPPVSVDVSVAPAPEPTPTPATTPAPTATPTPTPTPVISTPPG